MSAQLLKKQLQEFQEHLSEKLQHLKKRLRSVKKNDPFANPDYAYDNAAIDTDVREQLDHATVEAEMKELRSQRRKVEKSLSKIAKGTFGVCDTCKKSIPLSRLKVFPEATTCVACARKK